jgi:hypothetical protein
MKKAKLSAPERAAAKAARRAANLLARDERPHVRAAAAAATAAAAPPVYSCAPAARSEQYAAALMLGSQAASWVGLGVAGLPVVVPVTVFYWLWAVKNRLVGPLWSDLGVVTFGLVLASEYTHGGARGAARGGRRRRR